MTRLSLIDNRARADAIRHMTATGIRPSEIVAVGVPKLAVYWALCARSRTGLAPKAIRP